MNSYVEYFDSKIKLVHDKVLLKRYNIIWDKICKLFKKIDSEPVYNDKYIKAKVSLYNANFYLLLFTFIFHF